MGSGGRPGKRRATGSSRGRFAIKRLWRSNLTAGLTSKREGVGRIASVHCSTNGHATRSAVAAKIEL